MLLMVPGIRKFFQLNYIKCIQLKNPFGTNTLTISHTLTQIHTNTQKLMIEPSGRETEFAILCACAC